MSISSEIARITGEVDTQADLIQLIKSALQGKASGGNGGNNIDYSNIYDPIANPVESGTISSTNGAESAATNRLRIQGYIDVIPNMAYTINTNIERVYVIQFDASGAVVGKSGAWQELPHTFLTQASCASIRITLSKASNSAISVSEFEYMTIECMVKEKIPLLQDKTITENGTYTADEGYDGLGTVEVNIARGNFETWIFTLENGTTVEKAVIIDA